ncbi:MAG TPA: hypothetical protein VHI52_20690, partial [Verrucomicrobiae bacterium]|nr:hypothetical protein [Verrucomicrobiae bacterium]
SRSDRNNPSAQPIQKQDANASCCRRRCLDQGIETIRGAASGRSPGRRGGAIRLAKRGQTEYPVFASAIGV